MAIKNCWRACAGTSTQACDTEGLVLCLYKLLRQGLFSGLFLVWTSGIWLGDSLYPPLFLGEFVLVDGLVTIQVCMQVFHWIWRFLTLICLYRYWSPISVILDIALVQVPDSGLVLFRIWFCDWLSGLCLLESLLLYKYGKLEILCLYKGLLLDLYEDLYSCDSLLIFCLILAQELVQSIAPGIVRNLSLFGIAPELAPMQVPGIASGLVPGFLGVLTLTLPNLCFKAFDMSYHEQWHKSNQEFTDTGVSGIPVQSSNLRFAPGIRMLRPTSCQLPYLKESTHRCYDHKSWSCFRSLFPFCESACLV